MAEYDPGNTGYVPGVSGLPDSARVYWELHHNHHRRNPPAIILDGETLFVAGSIPEQKTAGFYARSIRTGEAQWTGSGVTNPTTTPAYRNGLLFSSHTPLWAISTDSGAVKWTHHEDGYKIRGPIQIRDGIVYVTAFSPKGRRDTLFSFEATSGRTRWSVEFESAIDETIAASPDLVLAISRSDDVIHAIDRNGERRWTTTGSGVTATGSLTVHDTDIYAVDRDRVVNLDIDGTHQWTSKPLETPTDIATNGDAVYVGTDKRACLPGWGYWGPPVAEICRRTHLDADHANQ